MAINSISDALYEIRDRKRQRRLDEDERSQGGIANLLSLFRTGGTGTEGGRAAGTKAASLMGVESTGLDFFKADTSQVDKEAKQMAEITKLVALYNITIERDPDTGKPSIKRGMEAINKLAGAKLQELSAPLTGGIGNRKMIAEHTGADPITRMVRALRERGRGLPMINQPAGIPAGGMTDQISTDLGRATSPSRIGPPKSSAKPTPEEQASDIMTVLEAALKAGKITREEMDSAQRILESDPTKEADIRKALGL